MEQKTRVFWNTGAQEFHLWYKQQRWGLSSLTECSGEWGLVGSVLAVLYSMAEPSATAQIYNIDRTAAQREKAD
jgi:hypothetical protein